MSLANELAKADSKEWIASTDRVSILMSFAGRNVHDLQAGLSVHRSPIDPPAVLRSEQWRQHPPEVVLIKRPEPTDAAQMQAYRQFMNVFAADGTDWALRKKTKHWSVFGRKIDLAQSGK